MSGSDEKSEQNYSEQNLSHALEVPEEGFNWEPVEDVCENFKCPACLKVLRDAMELPCNHNTCNLCVQKGAEESAIGDLICPKCDKMYLLIDVRANQELDETIRTGIKVRCKKSNEGCQWTGMISDAKEHIQKCQFYSVPCPNEGCDCVIQRQKLEFHVSNDCLHQIIKCQFECNELFKRGEAEDHNNKNIQKHLQLLLEKSMAIKKENQQLHSTITQQNLELKRVNEQLELSEGRHNFEMFQLEEDLMVEITKIKAATGFPMYEGMGEFNQPQQTSDATNLIPFENQVRVNLEGTTNLPFIRCDIAKRDLTF